MYNSLSIDITLFNGFPLLFPYKEYNKLPKSYNYWNKRRNNIIGYSEDDYIFGHYCDNKISYITQRMEDLEYILDIPEEHTFMYKLFNS